MKGLAFVAIIAVVVAVAAAGMYMGILQVPGSAPVPQAPGAPVPVFTSRVISLTTASLSGATSAVAADGLSATVYASRTNLNTNNGWTSTITFAIVEGTPGYGSATNTWQATVSISGADAIPNANTASGPYAFNKTSDTTAWDVSYTSSGFGAQGSGVTVRDVRQIGGNYGSVGQVAATLKGNGPAWVNAIVGSPVCTTFSVAGAPLKLCVVAQTT